MKKKIITLLFLITSHQCLSLSENPDLSKKLIRESISLNLHHKPRWKKLIHYEKGLFGGIESLVDDHNFFLAKNGKKNPKSELIATIKLFLSQKSETSRQCRFPARLKFLQQHLFSKHSIKFDFDCNDYVEWKKSIDPSELWLIFPSSYINSPSSMFGHTLLRLDPKKTNKKSKLLSRAVTYAAKVNGKPNGFAYAYKGLFGGYSGYFSMVNYHEKVKEYNRIENRDVWEYKLNSTEEELEWLVAHLWELDQIRFDYFFITENCAYQLLSLLDVMRPTLNLTDPFKHIAIPVDTIRVLDQKNWIEAKNFRASDAKTFMAYANSLNEKEKKIVIDYKSNSKKKLDEKFQKLPIERQQLILESAYKLIRLDKKTRKDKKKSLSLLSKRSKLGKSLTDVIIQAPTPPEDGHFSRRISIGTSLRNASSTQTHTGLLDLKIAYHGMDDPVDGFDKNAQINFLHGRFDFSEDSFNLESFDILNIRSLSPTNKFLSRYSWQVSTGIDRKIIQDERKLIKHVNYGFGKTIKSGGLFSAILVGAQAELDSNYQAYIQAGPRLDISLVHQNKKVSSEVKARTIYLIESGLTRRLFEVSSSYHVHKNLSLNIGLKLEDSNQSNQTLESRIQLNHYY